jgi:hypothetical protein
LELYTVYLVFVTLVDLLMSGRVCGGFIIPLFSCEMRCEGLLEYLGVPKDRFAVRTKYMWSGEAVTTDRISMPLSSRTSRLRSPKSMKFGNERLDAEPPAAPFGAVGRLHRRYNDWKRRIVGEKWRIAQLGVSWLNCSVLGSGG